MNDNDRFTIDENAWVNVQPPAPGERCELCNRRVNKKRSEDEPAKTVRVVFTLPADRAEPVEEGIDALQEIVGADPHSYPKGHFWKPWSCWGRRTVKNWPGTSMVTNDRGSVRSEGRHLLRPRGRRPVGRGAGCEAVRRAVSGGCPSALCEVVACWPRSITPAGGRPSVRTGVRSGTPWTQSEGSGECSSIRRTPWRGPSTTFPFPSGVSGGRRSSTRAGSPKFSTVGVWAPGEEANLAVPRR